MDHRTPEPPPSPQPPPPGPFQAPPYPPPNPSDGLRIGLGLGLLAVPALVLAIAYVLPTLSTLAMSTRRRIGFDLATEPAGSANWERLFEESAFFDGLADLAIPVLGTVIAGGVLAPLIAWCFHAAGAGVRTTARVVFSATVLAFAPTAMAVAWYLERVADPNFEGGPTLTDWTATLSGVVLGAGILVALAAFRGGTDTARRASTVVVAAALTAIALAAAGLQTFTFPFIAALDPTPPALIYQAEFTRSDSGVAAAMSTLLLAVLALLGLGAGLLFILARVRIDVGPGPGEPRRFAVGAGIGSIVLIALLGVGLIVSLLPWLSRLTTGTGTPNDPA